MDWKNKFIDQVVCGDCLNLFPEIPDNSIDLIVTSPPYNCGIDYKAYNDHRDWQEYLDWCKQWLTECKRVLKSDGRICVNVPMDMGLKHNNTYKHLSVHTLRVNPSAEFYNLFKDVGINYGGTAFWTDNQKVSLTAWGSWKSASCLEGDSLIYTDRGYVKIKDIVPGYHRVLTHDGSFCAVKKKKVNKVSGELITIQSVLGKELNSSYTGDHPVFSISKTEMIHKMLPSYKPADSIKEKDYLCYPLNYVDNGLNIDGFLKKFKNIDFENQYFWEFVGVYLAEGNLRFPTDGSDEKGRVKLRKTIDIHDNKRLDVNKYLKLLELKKEGKSLNEISKIFGYSDRRYVKKMWSKIKDVPSIQWELYENFISDRIYKRKMKYRIYLTLHKNEYDYVSVLLNKVGLNFTHKFFHERNSVRFEICNKELYLFLLNFYKDEAIDVKGTKSHLKIIPEIFFSLSKEKLNAVYKGYFFGDGCFSINHNSYVPKLKEICTSTSFDLLVSVQRIALMNGELAVIRKNDTNKRKGKGKIAYYLEKVLDRKRMKVIIDKENGFVYIPIRYINKTVLNDLDVYDLYVDKNKNFISGGGIVHNCPYTYLPYEVVMFGYKDTWAKKEKGVSTIEKDEFIMGTSGIWNIKPETKQNTIANFPVALPELCIKLFSYKGDVILDPFMGSWTTAVAAKKLHRSFVGFELCNDYCKVGQIRLDNTEPLFDALLEDTSDNSKDDFINQTFDFD